MTESVTPVIDLGRWSDGTDTERVRIAAQVDRAASEVGFLQITGHGVPASVIADMRAATDVFFGLPLEEKQRWRSPSPEINRGYAARGDEGLAYSVGLDQPPDLFEAFNIGPEDPDVGHPMVAAELHRWFVPNIWPDEPASLRPALVAYFAEVRRVAHLLTDVFAVALGLPAGWFAPYTDHSTDTLRVNHYATAPGDPEPLERQVGMGAHTDYGICTVLLADQVPGLQIVGPDGAWHDVVPEPDAFVVNLGDLTAEWTNDRWRSTIHQVLPPRRDADRTVVRRSVAFFHDGNHDALIECLPTCHGPGHPPKYEPVRAGDHLLAKLLGPRTLTRSEAADTVGGRLTGD